MMTSNQIVSKAWKLCGVLRNSGVSYSDYLEQITFLLFLKMADEYSKPPYNRNIGIPNEFTWGTLVSKKGADLENHYNKLLKDLSYEPGMIGQIFLKARNEIQKPAQLAKLISMINDAEWVSLDADIKGDIYESILEKNAEDTKSGAGQYFTPRALIKAMIECLRPEPKKTIADPACGTGGFFLGAYDFIVNNHKDLDKEEKEFLKLKTFRGNEIVSSTRRLCLMNLLLHNIGDISLESEIISSQDALIPDLKEKVDYVFANPPFGNNSSMTITNKQDEAESEDLSYNRQDFWVTTSNKQLNFVQHIRTLLKSTGKSAVVVPDNVLFEGKAGETVRQKLLETTDLHTILRLPTGIFYAKGVRANVIFFDNKPGAKDPWTKEVWIYDYRTNIHKTLKQNPLKFEDFADFIKCYNPENRHKRSATWSEESPNGRWRKYSYDEIIARDKCSLDIFWLKDDSLTNLENLPEPQVLAEEIFLGLKSATERFEKVLAQLSDGVGR